MSRTTIKPVPGYGDVLSDLNRVPVLTISDRVRRDIVLPVLARRSDSGSVRSKAKFLTSSNGSALIDRSVKLSLLQTGDVVCVGGESPATFTPPVLAQWLGIEFYARTGVDNYLRIRTALYEVTIKQIEYGDDVFWMPWFNKAIRLSSHGTGSHTASVHVYCIG